MPRIWIDNRCGDPEFVAVVEQLLAGFDYFDDKDCPPPARFRYACYVQHGLGRLLRDLAALWRLHTATDKEDLETFLAANHLQLRTHLGQWIFDRLPNRYTHTPLPQYYFGVHFIDREFVVRLDFLPTKPSPAGKIFFAPRQPEISFGGGRWRLAFSRHAIEQLCLRIYSLHAGEDLQARPRASFGGMFMCMMFLRHCIYAEPLVLPDGKEGFRLYAEVPPNSPQASPLYFKKILGQENFNVRRGPLLHVLGYCPVSFRTRSAVANTFLFPGYRDTPEHAAVETAPIPDSLRQELVAASKKNTFARTLAGNTASAIEWYHKNGIPQVVQLDFPIFDYRPMPGTEPEEERLYAFPWPLKNEDFSGIFPDRNRAIAPR